MGRLGSLFGAEAFITEVYKAKLMDTAARRTWEEELKGPEQGVNGQKRDTFLSSVAFFGKDSLGTQLKGKLLSKVDGDVKLRNGSNITVYLVKGGSIVARFRLTTSNPQGVLSRMQTFLSSSGGYTASGTTYNCSVKVAIK